MIFDVKKIVLTLTVLTGFIPQLASARSNSTQYDWTKVIEAIIQVESEGDSNAQSGNCCGAMQISPILVEDCNDILAKRKQKKRFKLSDRFSVSKSKEMFLIIQSHYNPTNNVEKAIRMWNGGVRYTVKGTQGYYRKVMAQLNK